MSSVLLKLPPVSLIFDLLHDKCPETFYREAGNPENWPSFEFFIKREGK